MKAIERLYKFLEYKGIKPTTFEKAAGFSNGYISIIKRKNSDMGEAQLVKVAEYFRGELNLFWLITGEGDMLLETQGPEKGVELTGGAETVYLKMIADKDKRIETLNQEIGMLKERAAVFQSEGGAGDDTVGLVGSHGRGDRPTDEQTSVPGMPPRTDTSAEQLKRP